MRAGGSASVAPAVGSDSRMMACAEAAPGFDASRAAQSAQARRAIQDPRIARFKALAPVVEHEIVRMLVVFLLAPLHPDHGEVRVIAALEERLVGRPVVGVDRHNDALELGRVRHLLDGGQQGVQVLRLALPGVDREELDVDAAVRRLADARHVDDGEADDLPALLQQQGIAERQPVDDFDFLAEVHAAPDAVGDPSNPEHGGLLPRLFERGVAAHAEARPGRSRRLDDLPPVHRLGGDHHEALGLVAELLVHGDVLRAVRVGRHPLERRLVLAEESLAGREELLADVLVLVVGQDGDGSDKPDGAPHDRQRRPDDLAVALLGDEASPRLHEPAMMHVLRAAEHLARPRPHLALEEIAEGLLDDVAHLGKVALAHAPDLDQRRASLVVESRPVHGRPHDWVESPASSSSSVITPEWSRPPLPLTLIALKSSWTTAVHGSGTPSARPDSMMRPRSLKCRSILKPGLYVPAT